MIKSTLTSFLFIFLCAISTSAFSEAKSDTYAELNLSEEFLRLSSFLSKKGFVTPLKELSTTTNINELNIEQFHGTEADISVNVTPFVSNTGLSARIAHWSGMWEGSYHTGAIAVINQADIYLYNDGEVTQVSAEELAEHMSIPLYALQGETPFGLTPVDLYERSTKPGLSIQSGCKNVDAWRNGYTVLGFLAWRFHHTKHFCYNGSQVSNVVLGDYVSHMDPLQYYRGITASSDFFYSGNSGHESMKQGHIENCVIKYGCILSFYPAVKIIANANGTWSYSTWQ